MSLDDIHYFDPFDPTEDLSQLVNPYETYTVRMYTDSLGALWCGVQLASPPAYKNLPSSVNPGATVRRVRVLKDDDPTYDYSEVSFTTSPSSDQFRVDYNNINPDDGTVLENYKSTGLMQFNTSEEGQVIRVYYWKTGPGAFPWSIPQFLAGQTIPGNVGVSGTATIATLAVTGDASVGDDLTVTGDLIVTGSISGPNIATPIGGIVAWPTGTAPTGWLACEGQAVSRTTYSLLFAVIGVIYGNGNGSTTFNVPDYRGYFLRGHDNSAGVDPDAGSRTDRGDGTTGDSVGTKQADAFEAHNHSWEKKNSIQLAVATGAGTTVADSAETSLSTGSAGGNETRPVNASVKWIIYAGA